MLIIGIIFVLVASYFLIKGTSTTSVLKNVVESLSIGMLGAFFCVAFAAAISVYLLPGIRETKAETFELVPMHIGNRDVFINKIPSAHPRGPRDLHYYYKYSDGKIGEARGDAGCDIYEDSEYASVTFYTNIKKFGQMINDFFNFIYWPREFRMGGNVVFHIPPGTYFKD